MSIVPILASITLVGEHIFQVLAQYSKVLSQYLRIIAAMLASIEHQQVNTAQESTSFNKF